MGSIRQTWKENGAIVNGQDYYPFGEVLRQYTVSSPIEKYMFTEKERDKETGYDYFGARYYDPAIGRWLSVDPALLKWSTSRIMQHQLFGLSPYAYVRNNPINRFDPDGYVDWPKVGWGALTFGSGVVEAVAGGVIAGGSSVTIVGGVVGVAFMTHGFAVAGFGIAEMTKGFQDIQTETPSGPLEAIGEATGGETGKSVGKAADATINAASGGNPLKNFKNAKNALPTSAKQAKNTPGYQKEVAKELIKGTSTVTSEVQATDAIIEVVDDDEKKKK